MGANQSGLPYEDPGPAITKERIERITKKLIQEALQQDNPEFVIESIKDEEGNEIGEGHGSDLGAVEVKTLVYDEPETYNWVFKQTPRDVSRYHRSRHVLHYNEREVRFFRDLLPRLTKFAKEKSGEFKMPYFSPAPYASWNDEDKILVMNNLKKIGYRDGVEMLVNGTDVDQTEMAVRWLAKFHALGYSYFQQTFCECRNWRCESRGNCDCGVKNLKKSDLNIFLMNFCDIPNFDGIQNGYSTISEENFFRTLDEIEKEGGNKKYTEQFQKFLDKHGHFFRECEQFREFDHTAFKVNTFTHGDAHVGNVMYQYGEENGGTNARDVTFIDFQFVLYKPAVLDLHKFIWTSTTPDTRKHMTKILKTYYNTFMNSIKQLGSKLKYTYDEFLNDFRRTFVDGLYWATHVFVSQVYAPVEEKVSMDELARLCNDMVSNFNSPEFQDEYNKVINRLDESSRKNEKYQTRMKGFMDDIMDLDLIYSGSVWL